jgi:hypothetical protein
MTQRNSLRLPAQRAVYIHPQPPNDQRERQAEKGDGKRIKDKKRLG